MLLQKLVLKYYWPLLRFINLEDIGGYYTRKGEDALILSVLFSHLLKNKDTHFVEINKPEVFPYSSATVLLVIGCCSGLLINTRNRLVLSYAKDHVEIPGLLAIKESKYHDMLGCLNAYKDTSLLYEYSSKEQLLSSMKKKQASYSIVILNLDADAIELLDDLMSESVIFSIMILNNREGLFGTGDMKVRKKLARKGFIFHTRLNGRDDIFVLSELINGFPSNFFGLMNTDSLQRWVSTPPGSDYSTPR